MNATTISPTANLALFYDSETTGLPLFKEPSEDPRQPHIVQLGALLVDLETREILDGLDVIVKPDGWVIPEEVSRIHGVTHEFASEHGIPEQDAITMLLGMWRAAPTVMRIGHNEPFDARIVRIGLKRHFDELTAEAWKKGFSYCTQTKSTSIVRCPPTAKMLAAGRRNFKSPTLTEAYTHFFGEAFSGSHGALCDARAAMDVYFALVDLAQPQAA